MRHLLRLGLTDQNDTDAVTLQILFNWPNYKKDLNMEPAHFCVMFSSQTKWMESKLTIEFKSWAKIKEASKWFHNIKSKLCFVWKHVIVYSLQEHFNTPHVCKENMLADLGWS